MEAFLSILEDTYVEPKAPFDQLFYLTKTEKLCLRGDLRSIFRYNSTYLRYRGSFESDLNEPESQHFISIRAWDKRLSESGSLIKSVSVYHPEVSLGLVQFYLDSFASDECIFDDIDEEGKAKYIAIRGFLFSTEPLEQARAILIAAEKINRKSAKIREKEIRKVTKMSYKNLEKMLIRQRDYSRKAKKEDKKKWRLKWRLKKDAFAVVRYNLRLNRKMGIPTERLKSQRLSSGPEHIL